MRYLRKSALLLLTASSLLAGECKPVPSDYYADRERGWFWREHCEKKDDNATKKEEKYKTIPKVVEIPWDIIDQIDPEQIAQLERDAQKIAIMYPTDHNVREHRLLQKWIMEKALAYTKTTDKLGRTDTDLAKWRSEVPISVFARSAKGRALHDEAGETIKRYADRAGLVVITQQGCVYCEKQIPILDMLREETGMSYRIVDMAQAPVAVAKLGVATTPDIFLVLNKNGETKWQRVASGLNTFGELEKAILFGLYALGELKDDSLVYQ